MHFKILSSLIVALVTSSVFAEGPWRRHTIDDRGDGADGVRLADFDGDGRQDIVTGWEESGVVRLYLNPGPEKATQNWPMVEVGAAPSPEDAVAFDYDQDGDLDVISCHEGKCRQLLVHRFVGSVADADALLKTSNWETLHLKQAVGQWWMYATAIQLRDGTHAFVAGSKGNGGTLTLFTPPTTQRENVIRWQSKALRTMGWTMSIDILDMDGDGDDDIVFNDRKGKFRGVAWLEQPNDKDAAWREHPIGATNTESLFIDSSTTNVLVTTRDEVWMEFEKGKDGDWTSQTFKNPPNVPFGKAIRRLPDGSLVMTANTSADKRSQKRPGIWIKPPNQDWHPIGSEGKTKFDRIECIDLDGDGDLDVLTCEERQDLGVVWYENPGE